MAKKPNYRFERQERERLKAEKKAAREAERELRKAEEGVPGEQPAASPAAAETAPPADRAATAAVASPPKYSGPPIAVRPIETMTPAEIETLYQNARRLAATGSARQKATAAELLPRLEAELARIADEKRQAALQRLAQGQKRPKAD